MEKAIEGAMEILAKQITTSTKADDALKFTQATLNLAHVLAVRGGTKRDGGVAEENPV